MQRIIWSDYLKYRAQLRGFSLTLIEEILRYSDERYYDVETGRLVVIGRHDNCLVLIPYESLADAIMPITVHATSRQQIRFRLKTGRYTIHELF
jgi:hypothetical protein